VAVAVHKVMSGAEPAARGEVQHVIAR
jgi:hypothetical protein